MCKVYSVIHGQCIEAMIQKLSANSEFEAVQNKANNVIGMLKLVKKICYKYEAQQEFPPLLTAERATMALYRTKQGDLVLGINWYDQFDNLVTVVTACTASISLPRETHCI
eukprot:jgi/Psemu1/283155/fgenesh1_pg.21_\